MGQEFFINNQTLENKVRELLPSQGGAEAGFDLSASTQIQPIIDLTESAQGSNVRADLQSAFSFDTITSFDVSSTTTTIINNTGYFRILAFLTTFDSSSPYNAKITLNDASSAKVLFQCVNTGDQKPQIVPVDLIVFCKAGDFVQIIANAVCRVQGCSRQIASIDGTLTNP